MEEVEAKTYFDCKSPEEDCPIRFPEETSIRYYKLEKIFNSFFPADSLSLAKEKSKEERETKNIKDSSFTYGEIV